MFNTPIKRFAVVNVQPSIDITLYVCFGSDHFEFVFAGRIEVCDKRFAAYRPFTLCDFAEICGSVARRKKEVIGNKARGSPRVCLPYRLYRQNVLRLRYASAFRTRPAVAGLDAEDITGYSKRNRVCGRTAAQQTV